MIDAQCMQDGGIEIVNVNRVLRDVVAIVVRLAIGRAAFDPAAGHPD